MRLISHRGIAGLAPENSLKAIRAAKSLGVDAIEIDVRLSKDGQFVLCHDASLRRLAESPVVINTKTLSELKQIKLKSGEYLAELSEAIKTAEDTPLVIDAKGNDWAKPLSDALEPYPYKKTLTMISFNAEELKNFKDIRKDIKVYLIGHVNLFKTIRIAKKYNFNGVCIYFLTLPFGYTIAKRSGLKVSIYTVNSKIIARVISFLYPKVSITTDLPYKLNPLIKSIDN